MPERKKSIIDWIPLSGWYGMNGEVSGLDIDDKDVKAMRRLINTKPNRRMYWEAVFYTAQYKEEVVQCPEGHGQSTKMK